MRVHGEESPSDSKSSFSILRAARLTVTFCISFALPILQIAFGAVYRDQCSINSNIPIYLIVAGACGIAALLPGWIMGAAIIALTERGTKRAWSIADAIRVILTVLIILIGLFSFAWFIVGNVWVFSARSTVQYDDSTASNYCHRTLYQFAFWILIVQYILMGISCCLPCAIICCQSSDS